MKPIRYSQIWRRLTAEQKQDLAERSETTYGYLKVIACKNGRCGRHMATALTAALIDMGQLEGPPEAARAVVFPHLVTPNGQKNPLAAAVGG